MIEEYEFEIERIVRRVRKESAKRVLLQFPDGLKPYACEIADLLEEKMKDAEIFIWLGSCFGACDVPVQVEKLGVEMIVQFGHSVWKF